MTSTTHTGGGSDAPAVAEPDPREVLADGLVELAEAIRNPFPLPHAVRLSIDANIWGHVDDDGKEIAEWGENYGVLPKKSLTSLRKMVRGLGGRKKEKHYGIGGFTCTRHFGDLVSVQITASRDAVCRKVPTGNKIIHAASYSPEWVEEEVEWQCDETILGAEYYGGSE